MCELISRLPSDISRKICNYTASPQPPKLMEDIRSFGSTYNTVILSYKSRLMEWENNSDSFSDWFSNDLFRWANENRPTMFGYLPKFYRIFERIESIWYYKMFPAIYIAEQAPQLDMKRPISWYKIDCYISRYFRHKSKKTQSRIFWGLLKPQERLEFINNKIIQAPII